MSLNDLDSYAVASSHAIPELACRLIRLRHRRTGSEHIHLTLPGPEVFFAAVLATPLNDSSGVSHLLEHCVLQGSRRFPGRPVLPELRALGRYINAITSFDWTLFAATSSTVEGLSIQAEVLLDALLFPELNEKKCQEEKAIIQSEVAGRRHFQGSELPEEVRRHLYPGTPYAWDPLGSPSQIEALTNTELEAFHHAYYVGANARTFTMGPLPLSEFLSDVQVPALSKCTIGQRAEYTLGASLWEYSQPFLQTNLDEGTALLAWPTSPITDPYEELATRLVTEYLLHDTRSPLIASLANHSIAVTAPTGFYGDLPRAAACLAVTGIEARGAEQFGSIVRFALEQASREGMPEDALEDSLYETELEARDMEADDEFPYPLSLLSRFLVPQLFGCPPAEALQVAKIVDSVHDQLGNPKFVADLIRRYFIYSRSRVETYPYREEVVSQTPPRKSVPSESSETLPRVSPIRLMRGHQKLHGASRYKTRTAFLNGNQTSWVEAPTGGVIYLDIVSDTSQMLFHQRDLLLPLSREFETDMRTAAEGFGTAGWLNSAFLQTSPEFWPDGGDFDQCRLGFSLKLRLLPSKLRSFEDAFLGVSVRANDKLNVLEIFRESLDSLHQSLAKSGGGFAGSIAGKSLSDCGFWTDRIGGISQMQTLQSSIISGNDSQLQRRYSEAFEQLLQVPLTFSFAASTQDIDTVLATIEAIGRRRQAPSALNPASSSAGRNNTAARHTAVVVHTDVCSTAQVYRVPAIPHPDASALAVLNSLLGQVVEAHTRKGGAYGGGSRYDPRKGTLRIFSYMDPYPARSLELFRNIESSILVELESAEAAVAATFRSATSMTSPSRSGSQAHRYLLAGVEPTELELFRKRILEVGPQQLRRAVDRYLVGAPKSIGILGSLASIQSIQKEFQQLEVLDLHSNYR